MLDDYKDEQPIAYQLLINSLKKEKNVHAYLFQINNAIKAQDFVFSFIKTIMCSSHYTNQDNCKDCTICYRINKKSFSEIKIIEPDGLWIKKEQLLELQQDFSKKAIESKQKVYIINEAEKLNTAAANSILKFLEEPEENIVAILLTEDIHKILKTIVSRCQVIFLKPSKLEEKVLNYKNINNSTLLKIGIISTKDSNDLNKYLDDPKNIERIEKVINFINRYEQDKLDVLLDSKNLWHDHFKEKEDLLWVLEAITLFYKDVLNYLCSTKIEIYDFYEDDIKKVAAKNNISKVIDKLNKILMTKEKIKNNANANLLFDKLIISMESGVNI